ncbi:MAG: substrate-binding domain-containing protein [Clostridia bacterium]|nr:substrate-binding domain-containing protein [Clostridia bacterium]
MRSAKWLTERIAEDIKAGEFGASGAFLPTQEMLRKKYAASNSTVVVARKNLEELGLIETVGRSAFITNGRAHFDSPYMKRRKRTGTIGVMVPHFDSLFFGAFCDELSSWLREKGYRTICVASPPEQGSEMLEIVKRAGVDGIVAAVTDRRHIISAYEQLPLPCVLVGARGEGIGVSTVDADPFDAAKRIARQFVAEGCKSFFVLRTNKYAISNDRRTSGFLKGLGEAGVAVPEENIIEIGNSTNAAVSVIVNRIRSCREKAGVLIHNFVALPLFMEQSRSLNILLHRDMEVTSFLDVHGGSRDEVPVTVAKTSVHDLVVCAGREIIRQITDDAAAPQAFKIPFHVYWNGLEPK